MAQSKRLNEGMLILSDLRLLALLYAAPITAISQFPEYRLYYTHTQNRPVVLWESDLSHSKVYEGPLGYVEGSPLTLRNHFIQPYRALDSISRDSAG